jgi:hypothetical protein
VFVRPESAKQLFEFPVKGLYQRAGVNLPELKAIECEMFFGPL